jgi:hypothetical protein
VASKATNKLMKDRYILSVVDESKMAFALSFCACVMLYQHTLSQWMLLIYHFTFSTLSTPYFDNSETSSALTVTAVTVVPKFITFFLHKRLIQLLFDFPSADSAYINIDIRF